MQAQSLGREDPLEEGMATQSSIVPDILADVQYWVNGSPLQYSCLENPMDGGAW